MFPIKSDNIKDDNWDSSADKEILKVLMNCVSFIINKLTKIYVFSKGLYNSGVQNKVGLVSSLKIVYF